MYMGNSMVIVVLKVNFKFTFKVYSDTVSGLHFRLSIQTSYVCVHTKAIIIFVIYWIQQQSTNKLIKFII